MPRPRVFCLSQALGRRRELDAPEELVKRQNLVLVRQQRRESARAGGPTQPGPSSFGARRPTVPGDTRERARLGADGGGKERRARGQSRELLADRARRASLVRGEGRGVSD